MTQPATTDKPAGVPGMPVGTQRLSKVYFDELGRHQVSRIGVPIDACGQITGTGWQCPKCSEPRWYPKSLKGVPVCEVHNVKLRPLTLRRPPLLPYRAIWDAVQAPLRPVWALPALAAAGAAVDAGHVPALAVAGSVPLAFEAGRRAWRTHRLTFHYRRGNLDRQDPQHGKRLRKAVDQAARRCGYAAATGAGWLTLAAASGLDAHSSAGKAAWTALPLLWLGPAAGYWRKLRTQTSPTPALAEPTVEVVETDRDEQQVRTIWSTVLAVTAGQVLSYDRDGVTPVKAPKAGALAGTTLEDWHRVVGGWAATIVGPVGAYESDEFLKKVGKIASAFSVKKSMVTVTPDPDDENRSLVMIQKSSPITQSQRWAGPDSIDVANGVAPVATYADGTKVPYELYRRGWGVPHVLAIGTTGSAKSELLNALFTIDRWAHHTNGHGRKVGIVADFLVDPQQGQSFAPFLDDLAAPVACSLDEAMLMVEALTAEMLRRNRYLARVEYLDERGRRRKGRKWWDPLVDGPILALTIDEAHDYLSDRRFATLVTKAGRMWRKCGGQLRIATHTPLLTDLGGSMALRDMLTGGFVWCGRTANSLSGPTAFNGRLPADPRTIPPLPGMAYILTGHQPKLMLARTDWEPDYYDWVRDEQDQPIGYPAVVPQETWQAFGADFTRWAESARAGDDAPWTPSAASPTGGAQPKVAPTDAVLAALWGALQAGCQAADMDIITGTLNRNGVATNVLELRRALAELRTDGMVASHDGRHVLTEQGRAALAETMGEAA